MSLSYDELMIEADIKRSREEPEDMQKYITDCICNGFDCTCHMPVDVIMNDTGYVNVL